MLHLQVVLPVLQNLPEENNFLFLAIMADFLISHYFLRNKTSIIHHFFIYRIIHLNKTN
jgi:hypothetical protein